MKFSILLPDGRVIDHTTKINGASVIDTPKKLCQLIKYDWKKRNRVKSFTQWAEELNESGEYEGKFDKYDALDNLNSLYILNVEGKYVDLYKYFLEHLPFRDHIKSGISI